eukprot:15353791-Ditylum_brightwellii.AAC.1
MNVLSVYALRSHARILQKLMLCAAPHVGHNGLKIVSANLPYNKLIHDVKQRYANLPKEQNHHLTNYNDFHIGGIRVKMLSKDFDGKTLREHLELQGVIGDITQTAFTESKETLDKYNDNFIDNQKEGYTAFPIPHILNTYMVPPMYAKTLVSDDKTANTMTTYDKPPNA